MLCDGVLCVEMLLKLLGVLCEGECERMCVSVCNVYSLRRSSLLNVPLACRGVERYINPLYRGWESRYYKMLFDVSDVSDVSESDVVDEELPPPSLPHEIIVKLKSNTTRNSKIVFIISLPEHQKDEG